MNKLFLIILLVAFAISCGEKKEMDMENMDHTEKSDMTKKDSPSVKIMNMMHMPMMKTEVQVTKNPDIDYIVNMIPHHQGAIDASEEYLLVATDENAKVLAKNIIASQKKEIEDFNALIAELKKTNTDYSEIDYVIFGDESKAIMGAMMTSMMSITLTENPDIDFLAGMTPHHQGAVDASMKILEVTKDERVKTIANNIIAAQNKEIADMATMIDTLKK